MAEKQIKPTLATIVAFRKTVKPNAVSTTHKMKQEDWLNIQTTVLKVFKNKEVRVLFTDGRAEVNIKM